MPERRQGRDIEDFLPQSAAAKFVRTNGINLHAVVAGPADGVPVVLLHGFPEFWYGWRHQIPTLVDAGYRVIAPDQRGYNRSDKPGEISAYTVDNPVRDAVGLLEALGHDAAHFIGHDWGAGVVWQLLLRYPEYVDRAVTINAPHPEVYRNYFTRKPSQIMKSWYIFFFQFPMLPEVLWSAADWRGLRWFIDTSNRDATFTEEDLSRYRTSWERPGAFTGMINWYRAMVRKSVEPPPKNEVDRPTMLLWGTEDPYLHSRMASQSIERCLHGRLELLRDGTHWVQHEASERINRLILEFLG